VLLTSRYQRVSVSAPLFHITACPPKPRLVDLSILNAGWSSSGIEHPLLSETDFPKTVAPDFQLIPHTHAEEIDPLYLFACHWRGNSRKNPVLPGKFWQPLTVLIATLALTPAPCSTLRAIWVAAVKALARSMYPNESNPTRLKQARLRQT
jgi:hypothetical protein